MTYEEAIEHFESIIKDVSECTFTDFCRLAIQAMGLQVAKKPHTWGDGYADGALVYDMYDCPNCEKSYELYYEKHDCCPKCGQRFDWSDWSEEDLV